MRESRTTFDDVVEVTIDNVQRLSVQVSLTGYVEVIEVTTISGKSYMEGQTSWGGRITKSLELSLLELAGKRIHVNFPNGQIRVAAILDANGNLEGTGPTPF